MALAVPSFGASAVKACAARARCGRRRLAVPSFGASAVKEPSSPRSPRVATPLAVPSFGASAVKVSLTASDLTSISPCSPLIRGERCEGRLLSHPPMRLNLAVPSFGASAVKAAIKHGHQTVYLPCSPLIRGERCEGDQAGGRYATRPLLQSPHSGRAL